MNATILHESAGRMHLRVKLKEPQMSLHQADLLEAWFEGQSWVRRVTVHERTSCVIIHYVGSREQVIKAVGGFSWERAEQEISLPAHSSRELNRQFEEKLVSKVAVKLASTLFLPSPLRIARVLWHSAPFIFKGLCCLGHRKIRVELLDAVSVSLSMARRDFSTAGSVMFLLELGELLEEWTRKKSVQDLARSMSLNVDRVWLCTPDGEVLTPVSSIGQGDKIVVRMGGVIPVDGVVCDGEAMVNQASLTGEAIPVAKRSGSAVYAGTTIAEGSCTIEVRQSPGQSRYDRIVSMIEQSEQMKSAAESKAASLADKLVPYTFVGSLVSLILTRNVTRALSVLMVDFSCALKLAMPLAVISAMRQASLDHITVKGGKFLEAVAKADAIVFDKTGTLTHACPKVVSVTGFGGHDENEMLRLGACLEEHFPHSMANAVVEEAKRRGLNHEELHSKVDYIVAHGISSYVADERVIIGSAHFVFEDEGCVIPDGEQDKFDAISEEYSHLYLAIDKRLAAVICIADPLRDEAKDVIARLRNLGIKKAVMLTGDSMRTARAVAARVGVDEFCAEVLPEDKASYVANLRKQGCTVIMVGDGINDSPALSEADAGIAISDGAAIAQEIADITIAAQSLWELVKLKELSIALTRRIRDIYRFVLGFNGSLIALGVAGVLAPNVSAMLHNLSTLFISLHSMTALPCKEDKPKNK